MAYKPWGTVDGRSGRRKCDVCGNQRAVGLENTSTRKLLCFPCIREANEVSMDISRAVEKWFDQMEGVIALRDLPPEQMRRGIERIFSE